MLTFISSMSAVSALANPEASLLSDARSVALGGAGVASNDYASSISQNPAGLASLKRWSTTGTVVPLLIRFDAPFPDPMTGQPERMAGQWQLGGLGTLAGGYRLHTRVAVGLATYVFSGNSLRFDDVIAGQDLEATAFAGELQFPIAVSITRELSVAASYRMTFARLSSKVPVPLEPPAMDVAIIDTQLHGWNFAGFAFGVRYRLNDALRFGISYRTKIVVDMNGDEKTSAQGETSKVPAQGQYPLPHALRFGSEIRMLDQRLMVTADLNLWLFHESHPANVAQGRPEAWRNAVRLNVGAEYSIHERVAVRAGFYIGNSATPESGATPLGITPFPLYAVTGGAGVALGERMNLDFALGYSGSVHGTVSRQVNSTAPGPYVGRAVVLPSVSLNYAM